MPNLCLYLAVPLAFATACAPPNPRGVPAQSPAITAEDIENGPDEPIEMVLQRKVPGLEVSRATDGSIVLKIRGAHSFVGDEAPLYVLDGAPFTPGPGGVISGIDPKSIETIKVYKGAEAAMYGIQGMNGVIVITTKKPGKR